MRVRPFVVVAAALALAACNTDSQVTSGTRSVHAANAPSSVRTSGLAKAIRSPQHKDENGPASIP